MELIVNRIKTPVLNNLLILTTPFIEEVESSIVLKYL